MLRSPRDFLKTRRRWARARSLLADARATDDMEKAGLVLPDEECIQQRIVWIAEAFGPMQIEALLAGLRAQGWDEDRFGRRPSDSIRRVRAGRFSWGRTYLPTLLPSDATGFIFDAIRTDLPSGVSRAMPTITTLPGSLTVFAVCFVFDRDAALAVDRALRVERSTQLTSASSHGISFAPPMAVQQEAVTETRRALRQSLAKWLTIRCRGAFGSREGVQLPAVELLTHRTDHAIEFSLEHQWNASLVLPNWPLWRATFWPPLHLAEGQERCGDEYTLRLRAREAEILPTHDDAGVAIDEERAWRLLAWRLNRGLGGTVAVWAASGLLRDYQTQLAAARDVAPAIGIGPKDANRRQREAQRQLALAADARAVASDVARWREDLNLFRTWDQGDWNRVRPTNESKDGNLEIPHGDLPWIDMAARWCKDTAENMLGAEERLRQRLVVEADLIVAAASLQIQRVALTVAGVALVVSVVAIFR